MPGHPWLDPDDEQQPFEKRPQHRRRGDSHPSQANKGAVKRMVKGLGGGRRKRKRGR